MLEDGVCTNNIIRYQAPIFASRSRGEDRKIFGKTEGETWLFGVIFASGCGWASRKKSSKRKKLKNILIIFYNIYNIIIY